MLVTLKEVLKEAEKHAYAVGAFNAPTLESARAAIEAAELVQTPIILSHAEVHEEIIPIDIIGPILIQLAKNATVPVVVHLDHGTTFSYIKKAINIGFTSVMIDASMLAFEENIAKVQEVVAYAHKHNVSVEAELGTIISSGESAEHSEHNQEIYTDPELAKMFVEKTAVDALAASFGTVHGIYLKEPKLDITRLKTIYDACSVPIVMHGGSGLTATQYEQTIQSGVRKINYYSYAAKAAVQAIEKESSNLSFYHEYTIIAKEAMKQDYIKAMTLFRGKVENTK